MDTNEMWRAQREAFGEYLRTQRKLAEMSLRQLAAQTEVSNAYLSQLERGFHQPSVRVLSALAEALGIPPEKLLARAGMPVSSAPERDRVSDVEAAIAAEDRLTEAQKVALTSVFRSYVAESGD